MKICACIAEYNPLHYGHMKHIDYMKRVLGAEKVVVVMSGNFTQRGEIAVLDKFTRAKHAVLAGADLVVELPTAFATANAEIFARGAVKIISSMNIADGLCFGVESGEKENYLSLAAAMNDESKEFKKALKERLDGGVSLAKAKFLAVKAVSGKEYDESLIASPNNILGLEYAKAILKTKGAPDIFPMKRTGDHNDPTLKKGETSAESIRQVLKTGKIRRLKKCLPPFVYGDLKEFPFAFDTVAVAAAIKSPAQDFQKIADCTEGLENRIKAFVKDNRTADALVEKVSTKRYTAARIRRILVANALGITADFVSDCLADPLYVKVLAVNSQSKDDLVPLLAKNASVPVLTRKSDCAALKKTAEKCFALDALATDIYDLSANVRLNEHNMLVI